MDSAPKQVLYVEDSATSQLLMRKYLSAECELTITPSPRAGLALTKERTFDLVVTDFLFPDGDALELITTLRRSQNPSELPVVVVSGSMDLALLNRVLKAGANDGMAKPLPTSDFRAMIMRMLREPYVRVPEQALTHVTCFQWALKGEFHEYCPELDLHLSAATRGEAAAKMLKALQTHSAQGTTPLGYTSQEKTSIHLLQS